MRLINTKTLQLEEYFPPKVPAYAILSHTWGPDEVTFQEFQASKGKYKSGYRKVMAMVQLARELKHKYIWADPCCIDKTDSAELAEAINSMYHWYRDAVVCVVYLEDVPRNAPSKDMFSSRWFTRGWTLQELVAPRHLYFYDAEWVCRGPKMAFVDAIFERTNVPRRILTGQADPTNYSLARRMSWAAGRETTRVEDVAYCLLGIFDVSMPLLYGEGQRAFRRLQEEIVKRNSDLTIFAWKAPRSKTPTIQVNGVDAAANPSHHQATPVVIESKPVFRPPSSSGKASPSPTRKPTGSSPLSLPSREKTRSVSPASSVTTGGSKKRQRSEFCLFAPSPEPFADNASLHPFADDFENFTVTNRGLFVSGSVYLRLVHKPSPDGRAPAMNHYLLLVGSQFGNFVGIYLIKIGPNMFQRDWDADMAVLKQEDVLLMRGFLVTDWYILIDKQPANTITPETFRQSSIHVPAQGYGNKYIMLKDTAPTHLWDVQDRLFVRPKAYVWTRYDMVLAMKCAVALRDTHQKVSDSPDALILSKRVTFVVLCQYRFHQREPSFVVFLEEDYPRETEMIMVRRAPNNSYMWPDLEVICPHLAKLPDYVMVDVGYKSEKTGKGKSCWYRISVLMKKGKIDFDYAEPDLYSVYFDIKQVDDYEAEKTDSQKTPK